MIPLVQALSFNVMPLDPITNRLKPNTEFDYVWNISTNNCTDGIILTHTETLTTLENGVKFVRINTENLSAIPNVICEFRDGSLRAILNYSDIIFNSIYANTINATNITADNYFKNGNDLNSTEEIKELLKSIYYNKTESDDNYWNNSEILNGTLIKQGDNATLNYLNITGNATFNNNIFGRFIGSINRWWDAIWVKNATVEIGNVTTSLTLREQTVNTTKELRNIFFNDSQVNTSIDTILQANLSILIVNSSNLTWTYDGEKWTGYFNGTIPIVDFSDEDFYNGSQVNATRLLNRTGTTLIPANDGDDITTTGAGSSFGGLTDSSIADTQVVYSNSNRLTGDAGLTFASGTGTLSATEFVGGGAGLTGLASYWDRTGTTLSPVSAGDIIQITEMGINMAPTAPLTLKSTGINTDVFSIYSSTGGTLMDFTEQSDGSAIFDFKDSTGTVKSRISDDNSFFLNKLGIGVSAPSYSLDVVDSSAAENNVFRVAVSGVTNGFQIKQVDSVIQYTFSTGNVGIGTTTPSEKLEVDGNIKATGTIQGANYKSGDGSAGITQSETGVNNFDIVIKDGLITSFTVN